MDENKASLLIKILGMQAEIIPIFNSDGGHLRFERAIVNCLEKYAGKKPFVHRKMNYCGVHFPKPSGFDFDNAFDCFRQYYGIDCEPKEIRKIAEEKNRVRETILQRIHFVEDLLRQRHKQNIWYGAL